MLRVKGRSEVEWDLVEEKGVHERVIETLPSESAALARLRWLNARQAQETAGTAGIFTLGSAAKAPEGCTCGGGMRLEAVVCPVHDV